MAGGAVARGLVGLLPAAVALLVLAPGAASADPSAGDWARLRQCESGDRYAINTGNGYYGAYQFDLPTWRSVGGASMPHLVPPDCAAALRTWQLRMNVYGYHFDGTGCYYAKTRTAVLDLQRANGIKASGLLGPQTWAAAWTGKAP